MGYRLEIWLTRLRGYLYWGVVLAIVGSCIWLVSAYTGVASDTVPFTDEAPGVDEDSTVRPEPKGIEKIKLTNQTMRVWVDNRSDFDAFKIVAPDNHTSVVLVYEEPDNYIAFNRKSGWPAGEYKIIEKNGIVGREFQTYTYYLEPADD